MRNALFVNTGAGRMIEAAHFAGVASTDWTWNPRLADFDSDGRVDVFITNGIVRDMMNGDLTGYADSHFTSGSAEWARFWARQPMYKEANVALRNVGELQFEDAAAAWGLDRKGVSFGAATADFDNDGDLDLVVNDADVPLSIYRNVGDTGHRVRLRLRGQASNRFGVGAKIELTAAGLRQASYVTLARGWLSSVEPVTTFGLGDSNKIDELNVTWPSGIRQQFTDLKADQQYTITEPARSPPLTPRASAPRSTASTSAENAMFTEDSAFPVIESQETPFNDFEDQSLLPSKLSELGPVMAWGDVDRNGLDDLYVGGPRGQAGRLLMHKQDGSFGPRLIAAFEQDRECEDSGAAFFDADGDGDLDLFIVSGSVRHTATGSISTMARANSSRLTMTYCRTCATAAAWRRPATLIETATMTCSSVAAADRASIRSLLKTVCWSTRMAIFRNRHRL
jgi:hypothetical protein